MTHPERVGEYLEHIAQAIERAMRYVQKLGGVEALRCDEQVQDAVVRNLEIIGEAANRIQNAAPGFVADHPELPWTGMRGMRNKMIHEYFDVDWGVVWGTVKDDLPPLKKRIDALLMEYRQTREGQ